MSGEVVMPGDVYSLDGRMVDRVPVNEWCTVVVPGWSSRYVRISDPEMAARIKPPDPVIISAGSLIRPCPDSSP